MSERFLGLDYGKSRIGIAISDPLNIIAKSLEIIINNSNAIGRIVELIEKYNITSIVIGMPLTLKGVKGIMAVEVENFINNLRNSIKIDVICLDERFTSAHAKRSLYILGVKKKSRRSKTLIDEMAAAIILQSFLDSRNT